MPFSRPLLSEIREQVGADIASALPGSDPLLRFSPLKILGDAQAGLAHLHYGYLDYIARQSVPYTAEGEFLEAWGMLRGVSRKAATAALGSATFSGTSGTLLPIGTRLRTLDGTEFETTADGTVASGSVTVPVSANAVGSSGNIVAGVALALVTGVAGIASQGVSWAFAGGADVEDDESYRSRVMFAYANPPRGGSRTDYVQWALSVPGVTRAWCVPNGFGTGTSVVYVMLDDANAGSGGFPVGTNGVAAAETRSGTKAAGDQKTVADAVYELQPVTAMVYVCAPVHMEVNFTIIGLASSSAVLRSQIAAAITDVFKRMGTAAGGRVNLSDIESDIAAIAGTAGFVITTPASNISIPIGSLPILGTITYS